MIKFEWDNNKNLINITKHNVDFNEAVSVFLDENAILISDIDHSYSEERFILIGLSSKARILLVCHCYKELENDIEIIRIISARKPTKNEERQYWEDFRL